MIFSPAKINLSLKVKTQLKNGYHLLSSHIIFLDLFDKLFIESSSKYTLKVMGPFGNSLPFQNDDNLITKTIDFCRNIKLTNSTFNIKLEKNIPVSAGLGGGSANSASIIRYFLNNKKIYNVGKIIQASKSLGADVPACIYAKPIFMEGIGEKISFIDLDKNLDIGIVLINPYIELSTKKVFSQLLPERKIISGKKILSIDILQDFLKITNIGNDLEEPAIKIVPEISKIFNLFNNCSNCLKFGMSGSGPTCYGIFKSRKEASLYEKDIKKIAAQKNYWTWSGGLLLNSKRDLIFPI